MVLYQVQCSRHFAALLPLLLLLPPGEVHSECETDRDCPDPDVCVQGSCQDACRRADCGANTECQARGHRHHCLCLPGFSGRPEKGCKKRKKGGGEEERRGEELVYHHHQQQQHQQSAKNLQVSLSLSQSPARPPTENVVYGCTTNDDCPDYSACRNQQCFNLCVEHSPCAPRATCRAVNHQERCSCPDGFIGSPTVECRPSKSAFLSVLLHRTT